MGAISVLNMKMKENFKITILTGGVGPEREISLLTSDALNESLKMNFDVSVIELTDEALPEPYDFGNSVVFPAIHGTFGEDGRLQELLDNAGINYAGSDAHASRLCMNKYLSKRVVSKSGVRIAPDIEFRNPCDLDLAKILSDLGHNLIIKPVDQGSSVDLFVVSGENELISTLENLPVGHWMIEKRIFGRELTVGILGESTLGVVEIIPKGGLYDYDRKYSAGETEYRFPAVIDCQIEQEIKEFAINAFRACGCRDFGRVDFILNEDGKAYFLEINTIPGLTKTSLLPKSASCSGYSFENLTNQLVRPAMLRETKENLLIA
jgi:D-alanine-D-alanine ligase